MNNNQDERVRERQRDRETWETNSETWERIKAQLLKPAMSETLQRKDETEDKLING